MHHSFNHHIFFLLCTDALPASPGTHRTAFACRTMSLKTRPWPHTACVGRIC
jgi:hypothetical protein